MEERFCQICGMPMGETDELYGTEKNGSKSKDYCKYCYVNGEVQFKGTMDEMIEFCAQKMVEMHADMDINQARGMMKGFLPNLKYWKAQQ